MGTGKNITAGQGNGVPPVPPAAPVFDSYGRLSKSPDTGEFEKIETQWADKRKMIDRSGGVLGAELEANRQINRPGACRHCVQKQLAIDGRLEILCIVTTSSPAGPRLPRAGSGCGRRKGP